MVYTTNDGERRYTPSLVFAFDKRDMIEKINDEGNSATVKCSCCGRTFSTDAVKSKLCPTCFAHTADFDKSEARLRYADYKEMLSLGVRLKYMFTKKYCFEDDGIILFVMGNKKYIVDKLDIKENGYLKKPTAIN